MAASGTFTQTIALEGAEDVRAKLQQIGQAGEKAFGQLKQAAGAANLRSVSGQLEAVKASATSMANGVSEAVNSISNFGGAAGLLLGRIGPLGLAIGAAGAALGAFARSAVDAVTAQLRTAAALGFTLEQYKGLSQAARKAGIDQDTLNAGLRRFSQAVASEAADQFKGLIDSAKLLPRILDNINRSQSQNLSGRPSFGSQELRQLQAAAGQVAQQLQSQFDKIDLGRLTNVSEFKEELVRVASQATEAGRAVRDALRSTGADVPALTALEKLDELVKRNAADFKSLGISFLDANGNIIQTNDALLKTLDTLSKIPEGIQRTNALQKAFGREGAVEFGKLIAAGGANNIRAVQAAMEATKEANRQLAEEAAAAAVKFRELDAAFTKFRNSAGVPIASGLIEGLNLINAAIDAVKQKAGDGSVIGNFLQGIANSGANVTREFVAIGKAITDVIGFLDSLKTKAEETWDALKKIFTPSPGSSGGSDGFGAGPGDQTGFARGGFVRGPGTGTSDSILAWLSNGEFVIRADGSNLIDALRHFGRGFAMGGLVDGLSRSLALPRFAMGGPVAIAGGGLGDLADFGRVDLGGFKVIAHRNVVSDLRRAARDSEDAQTGPRPSWYKGRK